MRNEGVADVGISVDWDRVVEDMAVVPGGMCVTVEARDGIGSLTCASATVVGDAFGVVLGMGVVVEGRDAIVDRASQAAVVAFGIVEGGGGRIECLRRHTAAVAVDMVVAVAIAAVVDIEVVAVIAVAADAVVLVAAAVAAAEVPALVVEVAAAVAVAIEIVAPPAAVAPVVDSEPSAALALGDVDSRVEDTADRRRRPGRELA